MAEHQHSTTDVVDKNSYFVINPATKIITYTDSGNSQVTLVQGDHASERFTFEIPRRIEGHDMSVCNEVRIHYINIGSGSDRSADMYKVTDLQLDADDQEVVLFSWLLSRNATMYAGSLSFLIEFICKTGDKIDYSWHTMIYSGIRIAEGMDNSGDVIGQYSDILEEWRLKLEMEGVISVNDIQAEKTNALAEINTAATESANEAAASAKTSVDSYVEDTSKPSIDAYVNEKFPDVVDVLSDYVTKTELPNASVSHSATSDKATVASNAGHADGAEYADGAVEYFVIEGDYPTEGQVRVDSTDLGGRGTRVEIKDDTTITGVKVLGLATGDIKDSLILYTGDVSESPDGWNTYKLYGEHNPQPECRQAEYARSADEATKSDLAEVSMMLAPVPITVEGSVLGINADTTNNEISALGLKAKSGYLIHCYNKNTKYGQTDMLYINSLDQPNSTTTNSVGYSNNQLFQIRYSHVSKKAYLMFKSLDSSDNPSNYTVTFNCICAN